MEKEKLYNSLNKTFGRRIGKKLSKTNKKILEELLPTYLYSQEKFISTNYSKKYLEIGFGMGEHFIHQINSNTNALYIGAEVYLNGVANVIKQLSGDNALIWPDDIDMILSNIPDYSVDGVYILFPDPWHKRRYFKKRLLNNSRLKILKIKLKPGGFLFFASDIEDYFTSVQKMIQEDTCFKITITDFLTPDDKNYIPTKYHTKALKEGRSPRFIKALISAH